MLETNPSRRARIADYFDGVPEHVLRELAMTLGLVVMLLALVGVLLRFS